MHVRKLLAGVVTAAVAVSAVALTAAPASAVTSNPQPDDTAGTPGRGRPDRRRLRHQPARRQAGGRRLQRHRRPPPRSSPTRPAHQRRRPAAPITLPSGDITRPNGSGAGKAMLYGAGNNTDIDFARSSSAQSTAETNAGLQIVPVRTGHPGDGGVGQRDRRTPRPTSPRPRSSAIYKGDVTNWSQVGGTPGVIAPKIPQAGSGTRSFFTAQLQAVNGGVAVTLGGHRRRGPGARRHPDQERRQRDRAVLAWAGPSCSAARLRLETGGFTADRALYNVVRGRGRLQPRRSSRRSAAAATSARRPPSR